MSRPVYDGVFSLVKRVKKKTGYHQEDIRKILYASMEEIRIMMEANNPRIHFPKLGYFELFLQKEKRAYNFKKQENMIVPARYIPKFVFNQEMVASVKKIKVKT